MITAIIVDDEKHCIDVVSILLKEYCSDVKGIETCRYAKQALETIDTLNPDLVFVDIEMPTMNGFEMLEQFSKIPY